MIENLKKKEKLKPLLLYMLFFVLMVVILMAKIGFFCDEIYSYGTANFDDPTKRINMEPGVFYDIDSLYKEYLTVSEEHPFDFSYAYYGTSTGVHPPLYFVILHGISAIIPGTFSKWYAGIINIFFMLITFYAIRKILGLFFETKKVNLLSLLFVLTPIYLFEVSYLRMYVMCSAFITLFTLVVLEQVERKDASVSFYIKLVLTAVLAIMSHYYAVIYIAFLALTYLVILLKEKKYKHILGCIVSAVTALALSVALYPRVLQGLFNSNRGAEATDNLKSLSISSYVTRFYTFFDHTNKMMFGGGLIGFFAIFVVYVFIKKNGHRRLAIWEKEHLVQYKEMMLLVIPACLYFLIVVKIAAYALLRYMSIVFPLLWVGMIVMLMLFLESNEKNESIRITIMMALAVLILVTTWQSDLWKTYLYRDDEETFALAKEYKDNDCIVLTDGMTQGAKSLYVSYAVYDTFDQIAFISIEQLKNGVLVADLSNVNEIMVASYNPGYFEEFRNIFPEFNHYVEAYTYKSATYYYLYK